MLVGAVGEIAATLGDRMRDIREERGLTQGDLAALCAPGPRGVRSREYVRQFEVGDREPSASELVEIADLLSVSPGWLLLGEQHESEWVAQLRGMERKLDPSGQRTVLDIAAQQVEETKKRREELLQAEEAEILERWRGLSDRNRQLFLEGLRGQNPPTQDGRTTP